MLDQTVQNVNEAGEGVEATATGTTSRPWSHERGDRGILSISVRTIEHHRSQVFRKLAVRSRAALVQKLDQRVPPASEPDP